MCGIIAVYSLTGPDSHLPQYVERLFEGSKNRGQDGFGIAVLDNTGLARYVSPSLSGIMDVLNPLYARAVLGHVRYTTSGGNSGGDDALQPFEICDAVDAETCISFAFNGNIVNAEELSETLKQEGYILEHDPLLDTEVLKLLILQQVKNGVRNLSHILDHIHTLIDGCCNIMLLDCDGNMAVAKDRWGFRPLAYAIRDDVLYVASESSTLMKAGCEDIKFITSGEVISIDSATKTLRTGHMNIKPVEKKRCFFEAVYFADPKTRLWGEAASMYRYKFGQFLGNEDRSKLDRANTVIVDIPSSSEDAARGYADSAGIQRLHAITKHPDAKRTFIEKGATRQARVQEKYIFNPYLVPFLKGKNVILMDDSVVRGTTLVYLVQAFKQFYEPAEIHIRIPSPPVVSPCYYGINMAEIKELIAAVSFCDIQHPTEAELDQLAQHFGALSLRYLTPEKLIQALGIHTNSVCLGCVSGVYPTPYGQKMYDRQKAIFGPWLKEQLAKKQKSLG